MAKAFSCAGVGGGEGGAPFLFLGAEALPVPMAAEGPAVVFAAMLSQTTHANDLPWQLPQPRSLAAVASWSRMLAHWDILAAPPTEDEVFVADGQTRGGKSIDPFTGKEPEMNPGNMRGTGLG